MSKRKVAIIAAAVFVAVDALAIITRHGYLMAPVVVMLVLIPAYFLPTIVAAQSGSRNAGPVAIVNLFLGWTFSGWVVALAMAAGGQRLSAQHRVPDASGPPTSAKVATNATKKCPDCAETVLADARVCKHCGYRFAPTAT